MKRKIKMVLLAMTLCLVIGLQSMGAVQAAVNYEACPFCGTRVIRGERTEVLAMTYVQKCVEHEKCDIYCVKYSSVKTVTCQTSTCPNYNREVSGSFHTWTNGNVHITQ